MIKSIKKHGFEDKDYGLAFLKDYFSDFEKKLQNAINKDNAINNLYESPQK